MLYGCYIYFFRFQNVNTERQRYVLNHVNSEGELERRDFTEGREQVNKSVTDG